jgi:predicted transcriptional regulator
MASQRKQPRSAITKDTAKQVIVYFPHDVVARLDSLARERDTDRSKLIRKAVSSLISRS